MNLEREPMIQRSYHIPMELFKKAFIAFQKKYVYPRNWLLTAVVAAVAIVYLDSVTQNPSNYMAYVLLAVCLAMIAILWFNPKKVRKNLFASLSELENDTYHVRFYEDGMTIATEEIPLPAAESETSTAVETNEKSAAELDTQTEAAPEENNADTNGFQPVFDGENAENAQPESIEPTVISFHKNVKVLEYQEFFMVYLVKQMFYVIPKSEFTDDELIRLRCLFTDALAEQFHPAKH